MTGSTSEIYYVELAAKRINPRLIEDIKILLPQLTQNAQPVTVKRLKNMLQNGTKMFGAFDGERLVGVTLLVLVDILVGTKAWIEDVVVDEKYRGRGIASELMNEAEIAARQAGATSVNLTSNKRREGARAMYIGRGYVLREDSGLFRMTFKS